MIDEPILLSFCLPVRRHIRSIHDSVECIILSCKLAQFSSFEICIVDNSATSNRDAVYSLFSDEICQKIKYYHNTREIGPSENILNSLRYSSGAFRWLLGDDFLLPHAVSRLLPYLSSDYFCISTGWISDWKNQKTRRQNLDLKNLFLHQSDVETKDPGSLLVARGGSFGFMSTLVFNSKYLELSRPLSWSSIGKYHRHARWGQIDILLRSSKRCSSAVHISTPLVIDAHFSYPPTVNNPDPWCDDTYTANLWTSLTSENVLRKRDIYRILKNFYLYVYCDPLSIRQVLSILFSGYKHARQRKLPLFLLIFAVMIFVPLLTRSTIRIT